ncbi:MAG: hypothetical protein HY664_00720 [Chloroflexi bacterium]|nr:hypothetical protein [Chloroflexota bacterium]
MSSLKKTLWVAGLGTVLGLSLLYLGGCGSKEKEITPTNQPIATATPTTGSQSTTPTPATGNPTSSAVSGKALFDAQCGGCHPLPDAADYTKRPAIFENMLKYVSVTETEKQSILNFLQGKP